MRPMTTNLLKMEDLQKIHGFSMKLMAENGILFHGQRAITIFKEHGFKVEANDIDPKERHLRVQLEVLKHCTKPFYSKVLSYKQMH